MSLKRRATIGAIWAAAGTWGQQVINFAVFAVLARLLGPEAYGLVAMAMVVVLVGNILVAQNGWLAAIVQRQDLRPEHLDSVFWALLGFAVGLTALVAASAPLLAFVYGEPVVSTLVLSLAPIVVLHALGAIPEALFRRELRFRVIAVRGMVAIVCGGVVGIVMAYQGYGVWALVGNQLVQRLVGTGLMMIHPWRPSARFSWTHLKQLNAFGLNVMGLNGLHLADTLIARLMIGGLLGPVYLGFFLLGWRLQELANNLFVNSFARVTMPMFAQVQGDLDKAREGLRTSVQMCSLIAVPSVLGLLVVAPELVPAVFGEQWRPAVPVVQVLMLMSLLSPFMMLSGSLIKGFGHPRRILILTLIGSVFVWILVPLAAIVGIVTVAAVFLARRYLVMFPLVVLLVKRLIVLSAARQIAPLLPILGAGLVMAAAVTGFRHLAGPHLGDAELLAGAVGVGVVAYALAVLALGRQVARQALDLISKSRRQRSGAGGPPLSMADKTASAG